MEPDFYLIAVTKKDYNRLSNQIVRLEKDRIKSRNRYVKKTGTKNFSNLVPIEMNVVAKCINDSWFYSEN